MKLITDADKSTWGEWEVYCHACFLIRVIDNNSRDTNPANWLFELADPTANHVFACMTGLELQGLAQYITDLSVKQ